MAKDKKHFIVNIGQPYFTRALIVYAIPYNFGK